MQTWPEVTAKERFFYSKKFATELVKKFQIFLDITCSQSKLYDLMQSFRVIQLLSKKQGWHKKPKPKNPTQKTHKKPTVKNPAKSRFFGFFGFFENKSLLWSTKRLRIVLGYIHAVKTMNNNLNNFQICYKKVRYII